LACIFLIALEHGASGAESTLSGVFRGSALRRYQQARRYPGIHPYFGSITSRAKLRRALARRAHAYFFAHWFARCVQFLG